MWDLKYVDRIGGQWEGPPIVYRGYFLMTIVVRCNFSKAFMPVPHRYFRTWLVVVVVIPFHFKTFGDYCSKMNIPSRTWKFCLIDTLLADVVAWKQVYRVVVIWGECSKMNFIVQLESCASSIHRNQIWEQLMWMM